MLVKVPLKFTDPAIPSVTVKLKVTVAVMIACPVGLTLGSEVDNVTEVKVPEYVVDDSDVGPAVSTVPLVQLVRNIEKKRAMVTFDDKNFMLYEAWFLSLRYREFV